MSDDLEYSESGQPILRHKPRANPFVPAVSAAEHCELISDHVEKHIGKVDHIFHEILSDLVHIDILIVAPTPQRDFWTLVTSGMSDLPMAVPPDLDNLRRAELMICLPRSWPMSGPNDPDNSVWKDEANYWPIRWLKTLARLPHEYDTWLGWGHTVPNADPPEPFAPNTRLCCSLLLSPVTAPEEFGTMALNETERIVFYALYPLYREEMDFKLKHGTDPLVLRLSEAGVTELLDPHRPNTCRKKWLGLF